MERKNRILFLFLLIVILGIVIIYLKAALTANEHESEQGSEHRRASNNSTFLYFAYGSNLWSKRIHIANPSAIRKATVELKGYRLGFYKPVDYDDYWNGAWATIIEDDNHTVWGVTFEIDSIHMKSLDDQELVNENMYVPIVKKAVTLDGEELECRSYQMTGVPNDAIDVTDPTIPFERKPSKTYLDVILRGAEESHLPEKYMEFLKRIAHNGKIAYPEILAQLYEETTD